VQVEAKLKAVEEASSAEEGLVVALGGAALSGQDLLAVLSVLRGDPRAIRLLDLSQSAFSAW
jgi:hypothetical protein